MARWLLYVACMHKSWGLKKPLRYCVYGCLGADTPNAQWNSDDLVVLGHADMFNKYCLRAAPSISFLSWVGVFYGGTPLELLILFHCICSHQQNIQSFIALYCCCTELFVTTIIDNLCWIYRLTSSHVLSVARQSVLGAEGLSLAFRHIVSSLLWYCTQHSSEELLHEVIICVGYFTINHPDNQVNRLEPAPTEVSSA